MLDFDKIFKNKFLRLYFLFGHAFVHIPASTKYSTPRPWSKFSQINSCVKTYAAFRVFFADWTELLADNRSLLCVSVKFYNYRVLALSPRNEIQLLSSFFGFLKRIVYLVSRQGKCRIAKEFIDGCV